MEARERLEKLRRLKELRAKASNKTPTPISNAIVNDVANEPESFANEGTASRIVSNIPKSAGKLLKDTVAPLLHPVDTAEGLANLAEGTLQKYPQIMPEGVRQVVGKISEGREDKTQYPEAVTDAISDRYGNLENTKATLIDDPVGAVADLATVLTAGGATAGKNIGKAGAAIDPINATINASKAGVKALTPKNKPNDLYQSAAKFTTTLDEGKRKKITQTALDNKIRLDPKGLDKLNEQINNLDTQLNDIIDTATKNGTTVTKETIYSKLPDLQNKLGGVKIEGTQDLAIMNKIANKFDEAMESSGKTEFTPRELQDFKTNAYAKINFDMAEGSAGFAKNETRKAMASGAKEALEEINPKVQTTNQQLGELLELKPHLERSVSRVQNRDAVGIGAPIKAGAGEAVAGKAGATVGAISSVIDNPKIKSKLAIKLNDLQKQKLAEMMLDNSTKATLMRQGSMQYGRLDEKIKELANQLF